MEFAVRTGNTHLGRQDIFHAPAGAETAQQATSKLSLWSFCLMKAFRRF